jgi:hypothetical protein
MSRRRYLSTDISLDLRINRLAATAGDFAVMLYTWMIPHAADDATLPADPEEIMYMVIPGRRDKTTDDVAAALGAMRDCGLIIWQDGELRFPAAAFYRYQTYIKEGNRRGANQQETPQDSDNSANQRKSAQNAVSPSLSPPIPVPPPVSPSPSPSEEGTRERAAATPPTPEPAVQVIDSLSEITDDKPYGMVAMLCEENGKAVDAMPADWRGMQLGIAKRLLLNHSIEQVQAYVRFRKTAWNGGTPFDLRHVEKDIGAWELAGSPASEPARASPNGHGPVTFEQQKQVNVDAAFEEVGRIVEGNKRNGVSSVRWSDETSRGIVPR